MPGKNLFSKVWDLHKVSDLPTGESQIFIGLHFVHEVTSPQAFQMLNEKSLAVKFPWRTFATIDHIAPTDDISRPYMDTMAEKMANALEKNAMRHNIRLFSPKTGKQGIVHVIGPELGLTQPGMTIACGDSHTSTHGAFGCIALGIGTSQVRDVLATQCLALNKLKVRKINVSGTLGKGVYAKDVILSIIRVLGIKGGLGYAYEYSGSVFDSFSMEERMTVCNMSIEGGARCGYVNPDQKTFDYIKGREYAPQDNEFDRAVLFWKSIASDEDASYDSVMDIDGTNMVPTVTWGINPGQSIGIDERLPDANDEESRLAYRHMKLRPGNHIKGVKIDAAFIGSCTNSRLSDLREAAKILKGKKVKKGVRAIAVPGSQQVASQAESEGLAKIFSNAGFEWRSPGCSMCLGMNPDKLKGDEMCASSSNRNFIGRMGSPDGRTLLMSPAMVAAAAVSGEIIDVRDYL